VIRNTALFSIQDYQQIKLQMLSWANRFNICALLDNHQYNSSYHSIECLLAVGIVTSFETTGNTIIDLKKFLHKTDDWVFGHVSYDFKNQLEPLSSLHSDKIKFSDIFFFQPEIVIQLSENEIKISSLTDTPEKIFFAIQSKENNITAENNIEIQSAFTKEEYVHVIKQLQQHILRGDCYEINFCQEFFANDASIQPQQLYHHLTTISPVPFACFYKLNDKFLICASPERYVKKQGNIILSQPVKGTYKRNLQNEKDDELLKQKLAADQKEKSENVMVVDLVRNDLSKICEEGSVKVEELFGIYSFPQVHQMISTIKGELSNETDFADVLKATFPMGSMTGAPKRKVMELIEQYEKTKRGIFSGCVGYIAPNKDFDFNVVIRSIMYNQTEKYLSYQVGSGITFNSNAENEYEECLLKAEAIKQVLLQ
jgi:para-aminobenzoate synthetase component 1